MQLVENKDAVAIRHVVAKDSCVHLHSKKCLLEKEPSIYFPRTEN